MTLRVLEVFGHASLQGGPRFGRRAFGVPSGGAFDWESAALANALLGNADDAPCVELALCSMRLRAEEGGFYSWYGAGAIQGSKEFRAGEELVLAPPKNGCRSYLALPGGVRCEDSRVVKGSVLRGDSRVGMKPRSLGAMSFPSEAFLNAVKGPQAGLLAWDSFLESRYSVTTSIDRVGLRLDGGNRLSHDIELPSEPSVVGSVQITPDGQPIIHGPDGPTIGGYPKIGVVIGADIPRVGQLRPGNSVRFVEIGVEEARRVSRERRRGIERAVEVIRLVQGDVG